MSNSTLNDHNLVWRQIFRSIWKDFKTRFQHILENLRRHGSLVESQANLIQIQESQAESARLQASLLNLEESERREKTLNVFNWLSSADIDLDQEANAVVRREYPESGFWIFENEKIKAWTDPNNSLIPLVWLNGIPGAGMYIQYLCGNRMPY